ncbi:MAG TPA: lipoyl synthase, partial [Candidatus Omnitrophota bacterium]|nr:lipoyl synthase [Candidatus Omnitrophota bacterium]HOX09966.1 lipoyl synthase [Candidatus Omnitrophota bacterium]
MIAKPLWLRRPMAASGRITATRRALKESGVGTVCESANCPNLCECFDKGVATFIILGDICTRGCRFCAVGCIEPRPGNLLPPDPSEPENIYNAVTRLGLKYAVITSVTRDDIPDGGAAHFSDVVSYVKARAPGVGIEVLVPDFRGLEASIRTAHGPGVDVFAHNIDTVRRLYGKVKPKADYDVSLSVLRISSRLFPLTPVKSGLMLGLGETEREVSSAMEDLRGAGCSVLTLGQYLKPSGSRIEEAEFVPPKMFAKYREMAYNCGFARVSSGPFVRSSYHAACLNNR